MGFKIDLILLIIIFTVIADYAHSQTSNEDFDADHLLIRVQLKENESIEKNIKVTNIGLNDANISIFLEGLNSVISTGKNSVALKAGAEQNISLKINGAEKGVFIGNLILSSPKKIKEIPVIIEIESKDVFVDVSANPSITSRISPGSLLSVEISMINLIGGC